MPFESAVMELPSGFAPGAEATLTAAGALALIAGWTDLSATRRSDLASAVATAARIAGLPEGTLPLTPAALRQHVLARSVATCGVSEKRMRNVRSGLRFVLRRLDVIEPRDFPLMPAWCVLLECLELKKRAGMIGFARFCSSRGTAPEKVDDTTLADFLNHIAERTLKAHPRSEAGSLRMAWNRACDRIADWPGRPLRRLQHKDQFILPLKAFPESFRHDLDRFGSRLGSTALDDLWARDPFGEPLATEGNDVLPPVPPQPLRPGTVELRKAHVRWAASALVQTGVPLAAISSLAALVRPLEHAREILRYLYRRGGNKPSAASHHVADVLRMIAKYHERLPEPDIKRLAAWKKLVCLTYTGMTEKNSRLVRQAMDPRREALLLELPNALMKTARLLRPTSPRQAASLALRAVVIEILNKIPLRLGNLIGLRLDRHLQRADPGRGRVTRLSVPSTETKNNRAIDMPVSAEAARFIDEWVRDFRPLVASADCIYLFPGDGTGNRPISPQALGEAIKKVTREQAGVELSPHRFRHLAAHRFLAAYPGHFEEVRQLLVHAKVKTTIRHYAGTQHDAAMRRFDDAILAVRRRRSPYEGSAPNAPKRRPRPT